LEQLAALEAHALRHGQDAAVAALRSDERQPNPGGCRWSALDHHRHQAANGRLFRPGRSSPDKCESLTEPPGFMASSLPKTRPRGSSGRHAPYFHEAAYRRSIEILP